MKAPFRGKVRRARAKRPITARLLLSQRTEVRHGDTTKHDRKSEKARLVRQIRAPEDTE